jgi:hypothetical protein
MPSCLRQFLCGRTLFSIARTWEMRCCRERLASLQEAFLRLELRLDANGAAYPVKQAIGIDL